MINRNSLCPPDTLRALCVSPILAKLLLLPHALATVPTGRVTLPPVEIRGHLVSLSRRLSLDLSFGTFSLFTVLLLVPQTLLLHDNQAGWESLKRPLKAAACHVHPRGPHRAAMLVLVAAV